MSGKDIYHSLQCVYCRRYFYTDELRRDADGRLICDSCRVRQIFLKRRRPRLFDFSVPWGVSLLEVLAVALILGVLAGITVPTLMHVRQKALEEELRQICYAYEDTELGRLAAEAVLAYRQQGSLRNVPGLDSGDPKRLEQLEDSLGESLEFSSVELQIGAAIKAIEEWQQTQGTGETSGD